MSRTIQKGTEYTEVLANDTPEFGANHEYLVTETSVDKTNVEILTKVNFQKGPIKENGVNGCCNEDLIIMVIDRLEGFQKTDFKCRENALAITKLEEALQGLRHRTDAREKRGVEGTNKI